MMDLRTNDGLRVGDRVPDGSRGLSALGSEASFIAPYRTSRPGEGPRRPAWIIGLTSPARVEAAAAAVFAAGAPVWIPGVRKRVQVREGGRRIWRMQTVRVLPGLFFIHAYTEAVPALLALEDKRGKVLRDVMRGIGGDEGAPCTISQSALDRFRVELGSPDSVVRRSLNIGDTVALRAFAGASGTVEEVDEAAARLTVQVYFFGAWRRHECGLDDVSLAPQGVQL